MELDEIALDEEQIEIMKKLIKLDWEPDEEGGHAEAFSSKKEEEDFIAYISEHKKVPSCYVFAVYDWLGTFGGELSKEEHTKMFLIYAKARDIFYNEGVSGQDTITKWLGRNITINDDKSYKKFQENNK